MIRDRVFTVLRKLCPAKLEGKEKGNLISVITSDIELLEVFFAHTISPVLIAVLMTVIMTGYIGTLHPLLGIYAMGAYLLIGVVLPVWISKTSRELGEETSESVRNFEQLCIRKSERTSGSIFNMAAEKRERKAWESEPKKCWRRIGM